MPVIVEKQSLGAALAFVVTGPRADRVHVAAVIFSLRMYDGVAVDLGCRGLQDFGFQPLGQTQHVNRAVHRDLGRLHWIELVVDRRRWAGQIVDLVDLDIKREGDVVPKDFEMPMAD